jgi:N-acetylneuraminic acid mutarotase
MFANAFSTRRYFHRAFLYLSAVVFLVGLSVQGAETWAPTGSMSASRLHHTATLLTNGQVLVAGGASATSGGTYLSSAELYDPATGNWTSTGSMNGIRGNHTATLLPNGKVLVTGGSTSNSDTNYISSAEIYEPSTGVWTTTGSMSSTRNFHRATLLANGRVLVAGGVNSNSFLASAELYNPLTGMWISTGAMNSSRTDHTATLLANGKVLVVGGTSNGSNKLSGAELYDPSQGFGCSPAL